MDSLHIDRHQCEVRHVLKLREVSSDKAYSYIQRVRKARGDAEANKLNADAIEQWSRGARGDWGVWLA